MTGINPPNFCIYGAASRQGGQKGLLSNGLVSLHADRKGLNVALQVLPLRPKLVLREINELQCGLARGDRLIGASLELSPLKPRMGGGERALVESCRRDAGRRISAVMEWRGIPRRALSDKVARFGIDRRGRLDRANGVVAARQQDRRCVSLGVWSAGGRP